MLVNTHKLILATTLFVGLAFTGSLSAQVWSLEQCLDTAHVNSKKLQISDNEISLMSEKEKEVKSNLLPKITANGDYKYFFDLPTQLMPQSVFGGPEGVYKEAQFGVPHNINANLLLSMPLYSPELYGGMKSIKIATEISKIQKEKTLEEVNFDISNLYYNAQIIKNQIDFIDANLINSNKLLKNIKLLQEQLLLTQADVDKVSLQVKQLETMRLSANSKYSQVLNGMKLLMGVSLSKDIEVEPDINESSSNEYTSNSSLDYRLAETKQNLLKSELKTLRHSKYLPTLAVYGSYGTIGYGYDGEPETFLDFYPSTLAGLKLSMPIFNGFTSNKKINQKQIEIKNTELQKSLLEDKNDMLVINAKSQRSVAFQNINSSEEQVNLAKSVYEQVTLQNKEGIASLTDVLLADNALRTAQQQYLSSVIDYLKADLELKKQTGNLR